jgi:hypothetical protein
MNLSAHWRGLEASVAVGDAGKRGGPPEDEDLPDAGVPEFAKQNGLTRAIDVPTLQDVVSNALSQRPSAMPEDLLRAFIFLPPARRIHRVLIKGQSPLTTQSQSCRTPWTNPDPAGQLTPHLRSFSRATCRPETRHWNSTRLSHFSMSRSAFREIAIGNRIRETRSI